jgi:hypothetical protein
VARMPRPVAFSKYSLSFIGTSTKNVYSVYPVYKSVPSCRDSEIRISR